MRTSTPALPDVHLRRTLLAGGYTETEIRAAVRRGDFIRLTPGAYVRQSDYQRLDDDSRYRLTVYAVGRRLDTLPRTHDLIVSHVSAAALHTLPLIDMDTSRVHLTRDGGGTMRNRAHWIHSSRVPVSMRTTVDGLAVTGVARSLVDLGRTESAEGAICATDAALSQKLVGPAEIRTALDQSVWRKGCPRARRAIGRADGRAESPGETRTRLALSAAGLPPLELQVWILNEHGRAVARVDLACLDYGVLIEFDGRVKYGRLLRPGQSPSDAVIEEKRREELITELGWLVIRVVWADLFDPERLAARVRVACQARRRLVEMGGIRGGVRLTPPVQIL